MGQAKRRGNREERIEQAQAEHRRKAEVYQALLRLKQKREEARAAQQAPRQLPTNFALKGMALMSATDIRPQ